MNRDKFEGDINQIIEEMMGFSLVSDKLGNDILDYINSEIKMGNIQKVDNMDEVEVYTIDNFIKAFEVEGKQHLFSLQINLLNCPRDMDKDSFYEFVHSNCEASCGLATDESKHAAFVIHGSLIFKDWKLANFTRNVFHHEIKHAFTHIKSIGDKDVEAYINDKGYVSLRKLYSAAHKLINNPLVKIINPSLAGIAKSVYVTDKQELSSFTQQAYKDMEDVTSFQEADKTLRETELYKVSKFLDNLIDYLENDNNTYEQFISFVNYDCEEDGKFPSKHAYLNMVKKRCKKYKTNVGKVLVYTKDRLREDALKEGYSVPLIIHDGSWCDAYKLGLY